MAVQGMQERKQSNLSTKFMGSEEDYKIYCQPCDRDGPRLPAYGFCTECQEHLCESCFNLHKKHSLSRQHTLLDKNSMPQILQQRSTHVPSRQSGEVTKPCSKHKKKVIEFFCQYHKALLCSVCVTLEHTGKSCQVDYIPDISGQVIDSKEHKDILKSMDTISNQCRKTLEDVKKITAKSNNSLANALTVIKKFRQEINQKLDELVRQVEDAAKAIEQENDKNLKTVETTYDDIAKSLKTSTESIKHLNKSKQSDKLFIELKNAQQMIKAQENSIHKLTAYDVKEYNFRLNEKLQTILEDKNSLGTLTQKTLKQTGLLLAAVGVNPRHTSQKSEICVKTSKDKNVCQITGMTLLTPELLIISDCDNNAIKMVDTCSLSVIDQLQLDKEPWDVASVTSTQLAVTLPVHNIIQFVSVSSNKFVKKHTLKVDGKSCYGISCYQGKLVVSFIYPAKLQILDINGTILTTVRGENIFSNPSHVTTDSKSIYVSDWNLKTVTRLNWQGEVISRYGGIGEPRGISVSNDGTVFVCDYERDVIEEIAEDCSTGKVVFKDLNGPCAVRWCAKTRKLYFSCFSGDKKHNNFLQNFQL